MLSECWGCFILHVVVSDDEGDESAKSPVETKCFSLSVLNTCGGLLGVEFYVQNMLHSTSMTLLMVILLWALTPEESELPKGIFVTASFMLRVPILKFLIKIILHSDTLI